MLDRDQISDLLSAEVDAAVGYSDSQLSADRIEATDFYLGKPFNSVPEGKSSVIATEVADTIEHMMPALMEIFMRSGDIVKFLPRHPEDQQKAEAATMLVNSVFQSQAQPYGLLHDFVKDALLYKAGVLRCGYDTEVTYTNERYEGLTELDVQALTNEPDVEVLEAVSVATDE